MNRTTLDTALYAHLLSFSMSSNWSEREWLESVSRLTRKTQAVSQQLQDQYSES